MSTSCMYPLLPVYGHKDKNELIVPAKYGTLKVTKTSGMQVSGVL